MSMYHWPNYLYQSVPYKATIQSYLNTWNNAHKSYELYLLYLYGLDSPWSPSNVALEQPFFKDVWVCNYISVNKWWQIYIFGWTIPLNIQKAPLLTKKMLLYLFKL